MDKPKYSIHMCHLKRDEHYMNYNYDMVIEDSVGEDSSDILTDVILTFLTELNEDEINPQSFYFFLVDNEEKKIIKFSV